MVKLIVAVLLISCYLGLSLADSPRRGRILSHNKTIVNCAKFGRAANQHTCVLAPFAEEGPFYVPDNPLRSDTIDGEPGIPLELTIQLTDSRDCSPLSGLYVHIWSANATGNYSGVNESDFDTPGELRVKTVYASRSLRGHQITDKNGIVTFKTIIPGWYPGRTMHTHIEVYPENETDVDRVTFIGQFYFPRDYALRLKKQYPYSLNKNPITVNNDDDDYVNAGGKDTILNIVPDEKGWRTFFTMAIDPTVIIHAF
ncbi:uncharacterized protein LOC128389540 [Panonychus citri]|uniref:uncharacterized protein LOC128389540 n=1 Tax=Panonychus citri TaxID=50023 RepID=UPI0023074856|nr:uncharacterized protein LOC128389540 [Panonychus citri]